MKPLLEDFSGDLDKVERAWIRRPVTIFLFLFAVIPACIIVGAFYGIMEALREGWVFVEDCW